MGNSESRPLSLNELQPGDLLLFRVVEDCPRPYLVRCPSWTAYNHAAFVVSSENGSVTICGTFSTHLDDEIRATTRELRKELLYGRYEAIYVRKLFRPLTAAEVVRIDAFARQRVGMGDASKLAQAVSILMSSPAERPVSLNCMMYPRNVESFFTSRLVAEMLQEVGRVQDTAAQCFAATTEHERVLRAPVKLAGIGGGATERDPSFFTPDTSPTAMASRSGSTRSLQTMPGLPEIEAPMAECR